MMDFVGNWLGTRGVSRSFGLSVVCLELWRMRTIWFLRGRFYLTLALVHKSYAIDGAMGGIAKESQENVW